MGLFGDKDAIVGAALVQEKKWTFEDSLKLGAAINYTDSKKK